MLMLIVISTFITTMLLSLFAYHAVTGAKRDVSVRIERYVKDDTLLPAIESKQTISGAASQMTGIRSLISRISKYFDSPYWARIMEHKLIQAGVPLRGSEFAVICISLAIAAALLCAVLSGKPIMVLSGAAFGYLTPLLVLRIKIQRRMKKFNIQLGDALILIANSLRTGYSFMQSIEMVSREMPAPISIEFGRLLKEMNLGVITEDALNNMAKRMNSGDLDLIVTAVIIQRQVGGNLAEVLDNIAGTIRERVRIKGEIKTLTAQGRISGIIISALPVCVGFLIYVLNPEYIKLLFSHPTGRMMLMGAFVSQLIGIMLIRKIVQIDV